MQASNIHCLNLNSSLRSFSLKSEIPEQMFEEIQVFVVCERCSVLLVHSDSDLTMSTLHKISYFIKSIIVWFKHSSARGTACHIRCRRSFSEQLTLFASRGEEKHSVGFTISFNLFIPLMDVGRLRCVHMR